MINYRLLGVILLMRLLPVAYTTVRINFLGDIPQVWGFNIASQVAWLNIIYEVISEGLLLPLYYVIALSINNEKEFHARLRRAFEIFVFIYIFISLAVFIYADHLVAFLSQSEELVPQTIRYIRLETIAILVSSSYMFTLVVFILKDQQRKILYLLFTQMVLTIFFDALFVSKLSYSLNLGVDGVAYTNIIVNGFLVLLSFYFLSKTGINLLKGDKSNDITWLKEWGKVFILSFSESLVRNMAFVFMILKMINVVQQQGTFWVTNQFIWGWLLLPILALGELIKRDAALDKRLVKEKFYRYLWFTFAVTLLWVVTIPLWPLFVGDVMGVEDYPSVISLSLLLLGFYVIFSFNNVIDSFFYGMGRTDLMLYQSLAVNITVYGTAFILFMMGIYEPTLTKIALMFGFGIAFDAVITACLFWFYYWRPLKKVDAYW